MHESLSLLLVSLGGVLLQAVGDILKVWLELPIVCQFALQFTLAISIIYQVVLLVGVEQVGVHLVTHHLIRDDELGLTIISSVYRHHAEIEQQAEEVVWVVDSLGREVLVERAYHESLGYQLLDDASVVGELFVVADEHSQLVIVDTDVGLHHLLRDLVIASDVIIYEVEHHYRVVHGGLTISILCKAIVVVPRLHHLDQLIGGMIKRQNAAVIIQHLSHFFLGKSRHLIEVR